LWGSGSRSQSLNGMLAVLLACCLSDSTQIPVAFKDHGWSFGMNLGSLLIIGGFSALFWILIFCCERACSRGISHNIDSVPPSFVPEGQYWGAGRQASVL
jgi:hypothetical protein